MVVAALLAATPSPAGTISLAWDPVADPTLAGYQVYWGTASGNYTSRWEGGLAPSVTLQGLEDCTTYYLAVKARDAAGNESASFSQEVGGYPRPVPVAVRPSEAMPGTEVRVTIYGTNFAEGATLRFGNPEIVASSVDVVSCTRIEATVTVSPGSALGATFVEVSNPGQGFGTSGEMFIVRIPEPPTIVAIAPASLATGVPVTVRPIVAFDDPIDPSTVDPATVSLLDRSGNAVAQAAGSPSLSANGQIVTIFPAASLDPLSTYRIQVRGGATGIRDAAGIPLAATFLDAQGFTTDGDTTGPVLSDIGAIPDATTALITWTTDEPAVGQVYYRKSVDTLYRQFTGHAGLLTGHALRLEGLTPSTRYTFQVRGADADGNQSVSPDGTFTTTAGNYSYITFEAESGLIAPLVQSVRDAGAFRGWSIQAPFEAPAGSTTLGRAELSFYLPNDGTWYEWVRLSAPVAASGGWFESIDGAPRRILVPTVGIGWGWSAGSSYSLTRGLHVLELGGSDGGVRADRVIITDDPAFVPSDGPGDDTTPPSAPTAPAAVIAGLAATLSWTNPSLDVSSVVVRYRTDGEFPQSPADGLPLTSVAAIPGAVQSFTHSSLVAGTTYRYAVFAVDESGNASDPATIELVVPLAGPAQEAILFSSSAAQYLAGIGTMRHDAIYSLVGSQIQVAVDPFLPPNLGLDGFFFQDSNRVVFSTSTSAGVQHAGGFTSLKKNNLYRYNTVTRVITEFYDFQSRGVIGVTSFARMADGRIAFTPDQTMVVSAAGVPSLTLRPKNIYTVDPISGAIALLLDLDLIGVRDLDALNIRPGGEIVFSTTADLIARAGVYVRHQNAYEWNPVGGTLRIVFDGRAVGVNSLDALQVGVAIPR